MEMRGQRRCAGCDGGGEIAETIIGGEIWVEEIKLRKSPLLLLPGEYHHDHHPHEATAVKKDVESKRERSSDLSKDQGGTTFNVTMEDVSSAVPIKLEAVETVASTSVTKMKRSRQTFSHLPSAKDEALGAFTQIRQCIYQFDDLGESQQEDVMACECRPLKSEDGTNMACGDNDCINFATSMECTDEECSCGTGCRNQRFQRCEYADIDVILTARKGYGIRANVDIPKHTFIYEYVGEVIEENTFRERMHEYDEEGIKHFYFMMIQQGEYIDATKKGGLGRFINHSCMPNCYVDKWVVGTKLRMGIFSDRNILAGEELTFDYNVDRYGAEAQPCYCDEPNCIGYIGGKTQSEAQPKLSRAVKEALGFDDEMDWTTATSRKRRRPKKDEDEDEDYVVAPTPKPANEDGVAKIMSTLLQAREQWVIVKLLTRLEMSDDTAIWHRVLKMHGYQILGAVLREWRTENVIVTTILHILLKLPRVTKNKIDSSGIEVTVKELTKNDNARVKELSTSLLQEWDSLEMGFRISRRPKNSKSSPSKDGTPSESSKTPNSTTTSTIPTSTAPKPIQNTLHRPQKPSWQPHLPHPRPPTEIDSYRNIPRGPASQQQQQQQQPLLPPGWKSAVTATGKVYYYRKSDNKTQWDFPVEDSESTLLPKNDLQKIIEDARKQQEDKLAAQKAEEEKRRVEMEREEKEAAEAKAKERAERKSQRDSQRHQRRISESETPTKNGQSKLEKELSVQFAKHVPNMIARKYDSLSRDEVKKYAKDIVGLLVSKDIKAGKTRIKDTVSDEKVRKIKIFVVDYMDKVMIRRAQKLAAKGHPQQEMAGVPRTSESVSTGTPQVPGSTPRAEREEAVGVGNGDEEGELSPTEFLKGLEMDGLLER